jgi:hypothetical protein
VGDVDGDSQAEIVTGAGPGGGPHVRIFNIDPNGAVTPSDVSFMAYAPNFTGGVHVAIGDVNGDGKNDIITGAGAGGGPHVRVFNQDGTLQNDGFMAYSPNFTGGVDVAVGNVDSDTPAEIITGAGAGGGPHVRVFDGDGSVQNQGWYAYAPNFTGGVSVASADLDNSQSAAEIVTGAGAGGGPHVVVFNGDGSVRNAGWYAYTSAFAGGVNVGIGQVTGASSSTYDIITGPGQGGGPHVRIFSPTGTVLNEFMAFATTFTGGVVVGGGDVVAVTPPAGRETSGGEVIAGMFRQGSQVMGRRFDN